MAGNCCHFWTQPQCLFTGRHKEIMACSNMGCCAVTAEPTMAQGLSQINHGMRTAGGGRCVKQRRCSVCKGSLGSHKTLPLWAGVCWCWPCLVNVLCAFFHPQGTGAREPAQSWSKTPPLSDLPTSASRMPPSLAPCVLPMAET